MVLRLTLFALSLLLLSGCVRQTSTPLAPTQTLPAAANPLAGTNWRLVSLQGQPTPEKYPIYLMLGTSTFRGVMGCNTYSAHYALEGTDQLRVELLEVTVELCQDAQLMRLESQYTGAWSENTVGRTLRFETGEDAQTLEFFDAAGNSIFLFQNALK